MPRGKEELSLAVTDMDMGGRGIDSQQVNINLGYSTIQCPLIL
jgi:hypothetical protein